MVRVISTQFLGSDLSASPDVHGWITYEPTEEEARTGKREKFVRQKVTVREILDRVSGEDELPQLTPRTRRRKIRKSSVRKFW